MDHIGIDVHKTESQICILGAGGDLIERRVRTTPERFADVLGARPRARILLEASTESEWVARCLEQLGHQVIVVDPNFAPMRPAAARSRRIGATLGRWLRPIGSGSTAPPIASRTLSAKCAAA
jgi:transposase